MTFDPAPIFSARGIRPARQFGLSSWRAEGISSTEKEVGRDYRGLEHRLLSLKELSCGLHGKGLFACSVPEVALDTDDFHAL